MRIVCPNCAAEYEVDAALVPGEGRDVQCSSCGHAWFVPHPDQSAAEDAEQALFEPPEFAAAPSPSVTPRPVDQAILDVLRDEAARETAQRQAEARPVMESQPEFGLGAPDASPMHGDPSPPHATEETSNAAPLSAVAERIARLKGQPTTAPGPQKPEVPAAVAGKRSDLLPEIDEINSSLRPAAEKRPGAAAAVAKSMPAKGGFGRGFMFGILIWVILLTTYILAPELARQVPAIAPALNAFVGFVDSIRAQIAQIGAQLIAALGLAA